MKMKEIKDLLNSHYPSTIPVKLEELLTDEFVSAHTICKTFDEMLEKTDIQFDGQNEFDEYEVGPFDEMIRKYSNYHSWVDFLQDSYDCSLIK